MEKIDTHMYTYTHIYIHVSLYKKFFKIIFQKKMDGNRDSDFLFLFF